MTSITLTCDRRESDALTVDPGPGEVYLEVSSDNEGLSHSVLLNEREKVEQLHKALADWLANPHNGGSTETLARWWGLSYASWLTLPRVLMQAMPAEWQERAGVLLDEYSAAFPNMPDLSVGVTVRGPDGKRAPMPEWLNNYRHPNRAEIEKCRGVE